MPMNTDSSTDFPTRLCVEEAQQRVRELCAARVLPAESIAIDTALNRVLAQDVSVPFDLPPFANSAMDGYALRGVDLPVQGERRFAMVGQILAGATHIPAVGEGECAQIMTGAPIPPGADTVVIKEHVRVDSGAVIIAAGEKAGANIRPPGEDYRRGDLALRIGDRLTAARLGVLASCGLARMNVVRRPHVALFVTGDELVPLGQALGTGQIHDSNRHSLAGLLQDAGAQLRLVAHLRDEPETLRRALHEAGEQCDLILSSGGVSAGEADFLPGLIAQLGRVHFWKVRMRPGMPILCGEIGRALVFALPGNPVSSIATFLVFARPALLALQGANDAQRRNWRARLAAPAVKQQERAEFLRATLECRDDGALWATPVRKQGSHMLRGVAEADALIYLPESVRELEPGTVVDIVPLPGLF
jgi:molybdopterin molybdotransferase